MEHAEALEQIDIAAVEPNGLERLMAGDTPEAAAVAGHLAGCADCAAELTRTRRTAVLAREVIQAQPDPELRARTLAFVRAVGRQRTGAGSAVREETAAQEQIVAPVAVAGEADTSVSPANGLRPPAGAHLTVVQGPTAIRRPDTDRRLPRRWAWLTAAAAAVVIAAAGTGAGYLAGAGSQGGAIADRDAQLAILGDTATTTARIHGQADARRVALAATTAAPGASGSIVLSASDGELVAIATGLPPLTGDQQYRCWVEAGGQRTRLGRMYWAGGVWTWAGPVGGLGDVPAGAVFGVSAGPAGGGSDSTPVLTGSL